MSNSSSFDFSGWKRALDQLGEPKLLESVARTMGEAGSKVWRDEARARAPLHDGRFNVRYSRGAHYAGELKDNIIHYYNEKASSPSTGVFVYSVSWRAKTFWARFVEFGYTQRYEVQIGTDGLWYTLKDSRGKLIPRRGGPQRIPAQPFLGPAFDAKLQAAKEAMSEAGAQRLRELLAGKGVSV